jgi:hypothetical protein
VGAVRPLDAALAADAIGQTFEVLAPMRRTVWKAPPGHGERFVFQRTDGPGRWVVLSRQVRRAAELSAGRHERDRGDRGLRARIWSIMG